MKNVMKRGFTLIELLVVIAIIGILAAVVLGSLNDARDGANDASAKTSINNVRNAAEIYYSKNDFSYRTSATVDLCTFVDVVTLLDAADVQVGGVQTSRVNCDVNSTGSEYAVEVQLRSAAFFCVDSTGFSGEVSGTTGKGASATDCTPTP